MVLVMVSVEVVVEEVVVVAHCHTTTDWSPKTSDTAATVCLSSVDLASFAGLSRSKPHIKGIVSPSIKWTRSNGEESPLWTVLN